MARVLGYGGLANTNGTRDFSGKAEVVIEIPRTNHQQLRKWRTYRSLIFFFLGAAWR
jgi:hypothetical protein